MDKACQNSSKTKRFFSKIYNWIKNLVVTVSDKVKRCSCSCWLQLQVCLPLWSCALWESFTSLVQLGMRQETWWSYHCIGSIRSWRVLLKDVIHSQYRATVVTLGIKATKCKKGLLVSFNWSVVKLILNQRIFCIWTKNFSNCHLILFLFCNRPISIN